MKQDTKKILDSLTKQTSKRVSMHQISKRMNERQVHLDKEVKIIERLDIKAQELSMLSYVR